MRARLRKLPLAGAVLGSSVLSASLLAFSVLAPSVLAAPALQPFCSPRFGFCLSVPRGLQADPPPDNGDGQSWRTPDGGVKVSAWGSYGPGVLGLKTPRAYADWLRGAEVQDGSRVTYLFVGRDRVVISGLTRAGRVFYQKSLLRSGTEAAVRAEYVPTRRALWNALSVRIADSLTPPRP